MIKNRRDINGIGISIASDRKKTASDHRFPGDEIAFLSTAASPLTIKGIIMLLFTYFNTGKIISMVKELQVKKSQVKES